jgi:hypothetical protein
MAEGDYCGNCTQEARIMTLEREVGTLNDKVWRGNHKPSLTEQMAVQAQAIRALCWLVAITCTAVVAQIVTMIFHKGG